MSAKFAYGDQVIIDPFGKYYGLRDYVGQQAKVIRVMSAVKASTYILRLENGYEKYVGESEISTPEEAAKARKFTLKMIDQATGEEVKVITDLPEGVLSTIEDEIEPQ